MTVDKGNVYAKEARKLYYPEYTFIWRIMIRQ